MELELIYFDGCPSWHQALDNLRQALKPLGLTMDLSLVRVEGIDHAVSLRFQGSPSIRLNGEDLLPETSAEYGLSCRVYHTREGLRGWPTVPMIRRQLDALGGNRCTKEAA